MYKRYPQTVSQSDERGRDIAAVGGEVMSKYYYVYHAAAKEKNEESSSNSSGSSSMSGQKSGHMRQRIWWQTIWWWWAVAAASATTVSLILGTNKLLIKLPSKTIVQIERGTFCAVFCMFPLLFEVLDECSPTPCAPVGLLDRGDIWPLTDVCVVCLCAYLYWVLLFALNKFNIYVTM